MGKEASGADESFEHGLLEHPHYTRPRDFEGRGIPEILLSGDHAAIARWRHERSLELTQARRPDLLAQKRGMTLGLARHDYCALVGDMARPCTSPPIFAKTASRSSTR
jgi:tRNA G37 N-methylase TrmD